MGVGGGGERGRGVAVLLKMRFAFTGSFDKAYLNLHNKSNFQLGWHIIRSILLFRQVDCPISGWAYKCGGCLQAAVFTVLYYCIRNFCNLIGLEQWSFSLI